MTLKVLICRQPLILTLTVTDISTLLYFTLYRCISDVLDVATPITYYLWGLFDHSCQWLK